PPPTRDTAIREEPFQARSKMRDGKRTSFFPSTHTSACGPLWPPCSPGTSWWVIRALDLPSGERAKTRASSGGSRAGVTAPEARSTQESAVPLPIRQFVSSLFPSGWNQAGPRAATGAGGGTGRGRRRGDNGETPRREKGELLSVGGPGGIRVPRRLRGQAPHRAAR